METGGQVIQLQQTNQFFIGKYRRNRKLQSCEPCRKSKLACDHNVPCSRCVRRRCVDKCYYHPSPLTRNRQDAKVAAATTTTVIDVPTSPVLIGSSSINPQSLVRSVERPQAESDPQWDNCRAALARQHRACSAPPLENGYANSPGTHGFLGSTSHTSIITEDLSKLGVASANTGQVSTGNKVPIPNAAITRGCQVLSFLQNRAMIDHAINSFLQLPECTYTVCGEFIMNGWLSQLWLAHGDTLARQDPEEIGRLCQQLFRNTTTPMAIDGTTTARQWVSAATGTHIRWAAVAMIANYVGMYVMVTKPSDPFFQEFNAERKSLLDRVSEVVDECISFCRECDALDDVFLWALLENYGTIQTIRGEASYAACRMGAELSSAFIAMGLHQVIRADDRVPFFLAELRKRLRAMLYTAEISIAVYLGRPPRLSHRYMDLDPPLDLADSQLFSEDPRELAAAVARLDGHGYNQDGELRYVSFLRFWTNFAVRREEILELALGNSSPGEVLQNADAIQRRTEEHWAALPHFLSSLRDGNFDTGTGESVDLHLRHVFRHGPQTNVLLLQRVLMRKAGADPTRLIGAAQTILSDTMRVYKRIESAARSSNFIYYLVVNGLRSAAILAIELLKQEQLPVYPEDPLLPRSKTIQELSVFTAKLGDLELMFGDVDLCKKGLKMLSRILDKILTPSNVAIRHCHSCQAQTQQADTSSFSSGITGEMYVPETSLMVDDFHVGIDGPIFGPDHDFTQWLESMDIPDREHRLQ